MKRRVPWWLLLVAFVLVPLVELAVLIQIGQVIGVWWTIALLIADSLFGTWLVKREGTKAWRALTTALQSGRMPATELADAALLLIGGTLMLTPGFVTDVVALLCILPFTRPVARRVLAGVVTRKLAAAAAGPRPGTYPGATRPRAGQPGAGQTGAGQTGRPGPDVVRGEVVD